MHGMLSMFGKAFDDEDSYGRARPSATYLERLLGGDSFIALAALNGDEVVGGLAAYELKKFEQERSEIYIYDLAVALAHRRRGIATKLIRELQLRTLTGASAVGIERDGTSVINPGPDEELQVGDRVLLLGDDTQLKAASKMLTAGAAKAGGA